MRIEETRKRLLEDYGIDVATFSSWGKIEELRLVANCVKHADGPSCAQLKELRPDLFVPPFVKKETEEADLAFVGQVFQPLAGEDLYVSANDFEKYVEAVKGFWQEFAEAFDRFEYKT